MRSTGEVASLGKSLGEELPKSWLSAGGNRIPGIDKLILVYKPVDKGRRMLAKAARLFSARGYSVATVEGMEVNGR
ncbi:MAG: hypothetical protein ABWW69_06470 [Pyrodictiaceae archaeon]